MHSGPWWSFLMEKMWAWVNSTPMVASGCRFLQGPKDTIFYQRTWKPATPRWFDVTTPAAARKGQEKAKKIWSLPGTSALLLNLGTQSQSQSQSQSHAIAVGMISYDHLINGLKYAEIMQMLMHLMQFEISSFLHLFHLSKRWIYHPAANGRLPVKIQAGSEGQISDIYDYHSVLVLGLVSASALGPAPGFSPEDPFLHAWLEAATPGSRDGRDGNMGLFENRVYSQL